MLGISFPSRGAAAEPAADIQSCAGRIELPKHSTRPFVRIAQSFLTLVYFPGRALLNALQRSSPLVSTPQPTETFLKGPGSMFVAELEGSL